MYHTYIENYEDASLWNNRSDDMMELNEPISYSKCNIRILDGKVLKVFEVGYHDGFARGYKKREHKKFKKEAPHDITLVEMTEELLEVYDQGDKRGYKDAKHGIYYQL